MACTDSTRREGRARRATRARVRFNAFWPPGMPFPPAAPWMGAFSTRSRAAQLVEQDAVGGEDASFALHLSLPEVLGDMDSGPRHPTTESEGGDDSDSGAPPEEDDGDARREGGGGTTSGGGSSSSSDFLNLYYQFVQGATGPTNPSDSSTNETTEQDRPSPEEEREDADNPEREEEREDAGNPEREGQGESLESLQQPITVHDNVTDTITEHQHMVLSVPNYERTFLVRCPDDYMYWLDLENRRSWRTYLPDSLPDAGLQIPPWDFPEVWQRTTADSCVDLDDEWPR